jgi:hypothetical protein
MFEDGSSVEADAIVLCAGHTFDLSFFSRISPLMLDYIRPREQQTFIVLIIHIDLHIYFCGHLY